MSMERSASEDEERDGQSFGHTNGRTAPRFRSGTARPSPVLFVIICVAASFILDFTMFLSLPPQTRIFEDIICRNYYKENDPGRFGPADPIPEDQCKSDDVQGELAFIRGLSASFAAIPSLLLSIPYGRLADSPSIGRKPVLLLSMIGFVLDALWAVIVCWFPHIFPLRAVWIGPLFTVVGGGLAVTTAVVMTMVNDIIEPENRANVFFQTSLAPVVARLLASPLSSWMMEHKSPWTTYILSTGCFILAVPMVYLLPETIHLRSPTIENNSVDDREGETRSRKRYRNRVLAAVYDLLRSLSFLTKSRTLLLILAIMFVTTLGRNPLDLLLQYVSRRYNVPLSKAAFTFTIFAAVNIVLLAFILPALSHYLTQKRQYSAGSKDLWMCKTSIVLLALGFFVLGLAPNIPTMSTGLVLNTLGNGFNALSLSLISAFVEHRHAARLFSVVCLVGTAGASIGSPLLAALYNSGLRSGPAWTGLPFVGCGILHIISAVAIWRVRLPPPPPGPSEPVAWEDSRSGQVEAAPLLELDPEGDK